MPFARTEMPSGTAAYMAMVTLSVMRLPTSSVMKRKLLVRLALIAKALMIASLLLVLSHS
jgi:hypothetical protein